MVEVLIDLYEISTRMTRTLPITPTARTRLKNTTNIKRSRNTEEKKKISTRMNSLLPIRPTARTRLKTKIGLCKNKKIRLGQRR